MEGVPTETFFGFKLPHIAYRRNDNSLKHDSFTENSISVGVAEALKKSPMAPTIDTFRGTRFRNEAVTSA